jgi:hypothetical protein
VPRTSYALKIAARSIAARVYGAEELRRPPTPDPRPPTPDPRPPTPDEESCRKLKAESRKLKAES